MRVSLTEEASHTADRLISCGQWKAMSHLPLILKAGVEVVVLVIFK